MKQDQKIVYVCLCHPLTDPKIDVLGVFSTKERARECIVKASKWLQQKNPKDYQDNGNYIIGCSNNKIGFYTAFHSYEYYYVERTLDVEIPPE